MSMRKPLAELTPHGRYMRKYTVENWEKLRAYQKAYRQRNREHLLQKMRDYNANHRDYFRAQSKQLRQETKQEILAIYGGNPPSCSCCGLMQIEFLTLDHINGGGNAERRVLGIPRGFVYYRWLREQGYPDGLQVLCMNCNHAKGIYGICPHQKSKEAKKL